MGFVSQRLRDSARDQPCSLGFPGICNHDPETTVLAHLPSPVKGMGNKGDDFHAVFACSACHAAMDDRRVLSPEVYQLDALRRTIRFWVLNGYLTIVGDKGDEPKKRKASAKLTGRPPRQLYGKRRT